MPKEGHELLDPIHGFIKLDADERRVLDSAPYQRLRNIHQLAFTYLVYPGATHRRFEHCLGVMELAGRIFDVITDPANMKLVSDIQGLPINQGKRATELPYWRKIVRIAALCHDMGHLPFSHAAEDLLPKDWTHERLSAEIIRSAPMQEFWDSMSPKLETQHILKVAVGEKDFLRSYTTEPFTDWERLMSQIITSNICGADRVDYLLRDAFHAGVAYGRFDHIRLIETVRILPWVKDPGARPEPYLSVGEGGLPAAEALYLARYFMFRQLYFHPVRRIYDHHLKVFLQQWLPGGKFLSGTEAPAEVVQKLLAQSDNEALVDINIASADTASTAHEVAKRIVERRHFRVVARGRQNVDSDVAWIEKIYDGLCDLFGDVNNNLVFHDRYPKPKNTEEGKATAGRELSFPILYTDGSVGSALDISQLFVALPENKINYVFVAPECKEQAMKWIAANA